MLRGCYDEHDVNRVVDLCKKYAIAYLKMKKVSGSFFISGDTIDSLAYSFIADIFERCEEGHFVNLEHYFNDKPVEKAEFHQIEQELRRLVFTKVNDNLFRHFGEHDPSLRKIIRNIKLALESAPINACIELRGNRLIVNDENSKSHLPSFPPEFLEIYLCSGVDQSTLIPDIVHKTVEILNHQQLYRKEISITQMAVSIRKCFVNLHYEQENITQNTMQKLLNGDMNHFIGKSTEQIQDKVRPKYIRNGKMTPEEFDKYLAAATDILKAQFTDTEEKKDSQYEYLAVYFKDLEYPVFRKKYRSKLEYFVRLIREDMIRRFKNDYLKIKQTG